MWKVLLVSGIVLLRLNAKVSAQKKVMEPVHQVVSGFAPIEILVQMHCQVVRQKSIG